MAQPDLSDPVAAAEYGYEQGWTDGLPVVPPTAARLEQFLAAAGRPADDVAATMTTIGRSCTVETAAVNAIMAGCKPEYFPVVLAALEGLSDDDRYNYYGSSASTGSAAHLVLVNGPIRDELEINYQGNFYGPGFRANATIGRTIRLLNLNVFGMTPGVLDRSTQGQPAKYTLCFGEYEEASPWEPLHVERGFDANTSTVTVLPCRQPGMVGLHDVGDPEQVLRVFADTLTGLGLIGGGETFIVFSPEHAGIVGKSGWSKQQVKEFLFEHAKRPAEDLHAVGIGERAAAGTMVHRGQSPDDFVLVVAGGDAGGHSSYMPSWVGRSVTRPIKVP